MKFRICILAVIFPFFAALSLAEDDEASKKAEQVQSDVKAMIEAVYDADVQTIIKFTHPVVIDSMGGKEVAERMLEGPLKKTKEAGIEIEDFSFPSAPVFLAGKENEFVVVPVKLVIDAGEKKLETLNFQFGTRKSGEEDWAYIEGQRVNPEVAVKLFPDFPTDYKFPETYVKNLKP